MSTPFKWERVTTSPASSPTAAPRPNQTIRSDNSRIVPHSPGQQSLVWFLGDIHKTDTHYANNATLPCIGNECPLCAVNPPKENGFAAVYVRGGNTLEGEEVWNPRVLRVFGRNFNIGDGLRGRVYRVKQISGRKISGGNGARNEWEYTYSYTKTPPIPEFDVLAVMNSVWYPAKYPPVYLDDLHVSIKSKPIVQQEPTFKESLKELSTQQLVELLAVHKRSNALPALARTIEDELHAREVVLSTDDGPGEGAKPKPGRFKVGVENGMAYSEPVKPDTIPLKRKGGVA